MNKEVLTVHMALTEMKTIRKRIEKAIEGIVPIGTKENSSKNVNGVAVAKFEETAKSMEQRAIDLMARQNALKAALYEYNTSTKIKVGDEIMTVAHALWLKEYGMEQKRALLKHYENAYTRAVKEVEKANGVALNQAAERAADVVYSSKDKSESDEYMKMCKTYKENHQLVYVDPLKLQKRINELSDEIEMFDAEVDARIQTANATTEITIEY